MPKLLVLFHSRTGTTATLADAVAEGARGVRFAEVDLRRVDDLVSASVVEANPAWMASRARLASRYRALEHADALADYDAIIMGSPARDGVLSAELKHVLDQTEPLRTSRVLINKVGSAFASSTGAAWHAASPVVWSMLAPMASLGMILVPPGYPLPVAMQAAQEGQVARGGPEAGVESEVAGPSGAAGPGEHELAAARHLGKRVAEVVGWITHARSHHH